MSRGTGVWSAPLSPHGSINIAQALRVAVSQLTPEERQSIMPFFHLLHASELNPALCEVAKFHATPDAEAYQQDTAGAEAYAAQYKDLAIRSDFDASDAQLLSFETTTTSESKDDPSGFVGLNLCLF